MSEEDHVIEGKEPVWVVREHKYDADIELQIGSPTVTGHVESDWIEDGEYSCSCGLSFGNWADAEDHLEEMHDSPSENDGGQSSD